MLITDWPERIVITASLNLRHETHRPARFKSAQPAKDRTFSLYQPKMSVSLSDEEVQTFLSLIAEEQIQRELDGAMRNEKALCIYFLPFVYF